MIIEFNDNLKTGIMKIDLQHKELFKKVNDLYQACLQGQGKDEIRKMMSYLSKYASEHFELEEEYMKTYIYPGFTKHHNAHETFKKTYEELAKSFELEGPTPGFVVKVNKTLVNWLIQHLGGEDKALAEFLKGKI